MFAALIDPTPKAEDNEQRTQLMALLADLPEEKRAAIAALLEKLLPAAASDEEQPPKAADSDRSAYAGWCGNTGGRYHPPVDGRYPPGHGQGQIGKNRNGPDGAAPCF